MAAGMLTCWRLFFGGLDSWDTPRIPNHRAPNHPLTIGWVYFFFVSQPRVWQTTTVLSTKTNPMLVFGSVKFAPLLPHERKNTEFPLTPNMFFVWNLQRFAVLAIFKSWWFICLYRFMENMHGVLVFCSICSGWSSFMYVDCMCDPNWTYL